MFVHFSCTSLCMPYFSNNTKKGIQKLIKMSPPKCWKKTQDLSPKIVLDQTQIVTNSKLDRVKLEIELLTAFQKILIFEPLCGQI